MSACFLPSAPDLKIEQIPASSSLSPTSARTPPLMWLPWVKTRPSSATSTSNSPSTALVAAASPRLSFSSPSLKDLQALLLSDAATPSPPPAAPCSPSSSVRVFHRVRVAASALRALRTLQAPPSAGGGAAFEADRRVVLYFTSLHVVRSTYEDCRAVRAILRGLRVAVDERDLAMDTRYFQELAALLPRPAAPRRVTLPQVFVGGRHLGGADEVRRLHEAGELRRVVAGAVAASLATCGRCGGERYVLCGSCNGSHKRYSAKGGSGFRTCAVCNENGLVRCPDCSPPDV
jgi:glutaredoxin domain-containing cysteine-rich protein 1